MLLHEFIIVLKVQPVEFVLLYLATLRNILKGTLKSEGHLKIQPQFLNGFPMRFLYKWHSNMKSFFFLSH